MASINKLKSINNDLKLKTNLILNEEHVVL